MDERHSGGWGTGDDAYMLETDAQGNLIVEHGDDHREVYISNSSTAMSRADVAAHYNSLNGTSLTVDDISNRWLVEHPEYGGSKDLPLAEVTGAALWKKMLTDGTGSHWLLMERDYSYSLDLLPSHAEGESTLHPIYIGAWGEGEDPIHTEGMNENHSQSEFVIQGIQFEENLRLLGLDNYILDDLVVSAYGSDSTAIGIGSPNGNTSYGVTVRNTTIYDSYRENPATGGDWQIGADRIQGLFAGGTDGLLIEGVFVDHSGWGEGFDPNWDGSLPQTPSNQSHNVYIAETSVDTTFRDSILMRGASYGLQMKAGGFIEDNVFIDNNGGFATWGIPNFTFATSNLVTSGGARASDQEGALTMGISAGGMMNTYLDNIVAHLADPDNPEEFASKDGNGRDPGGRDAFFNNSIVYNWVAQNFGPDGLESNADRNLEGLDTSVLDQTTIQNFTAALLGQSEATIDNLAQYLRGIEPSTIKSEATGILAYFQEAFGITPDGRVEAETLRFVPDDLADGVRWDNRINWTTEDLPGTVVGDSVDLGGNWVVFATLTDTIDDLELGSGGRLTVTSGRLDVEGTASVGAAGGEIDVKHAGQLWLNGYHDEDRLDIDVEGGRFANEGFSDGLLDIHVTGGQALLGVDDAVMELGQDGVLTVEGSSAKTGFDGAAGGVSVLRMETGSQLRMVADTDGFSAIEEFRSGAYANDVPKVLSAFDMGEGTLLIDVSAIAGGSAREDVLVETDQIVGMFDGVEFIGLGLDQDAVLTVDYGNDRVSITLGTAGQGAGQMNVITLGDMLDATEDAEIWNALIEGQGTYEEIDANTPKPMLIDEWYEIV